MENFFKNTSVKNKNYISIQNKFELLSTIQPDTAILNELAIISCLIKNKRLTASNISKEIETINSKAY